MAKLPSSIGRLNIPWLPASVECGLLGAIDADVGKPAAAWSGLDPLPLFSGRRRRAEIELRRLGLRDILQFEHRAQRRLVLIGLHLRARLSVVNCHDQKSLSGTGCGIVSL